MFECIETKEMCKNKTKWMKIKLNFFKIMSNIINFENLVSFWMNSYKESLQRHPLLSNYYHIFRCFYYDTCLEVLFWISSFFFKYYNSFKCFKYRLKFILATQVPTVSVIKGLIQLKKEQNNSKCLQFYNYSY